MPDLRYWLVAKTPAVQAQPAAAARSDIAQPSSQPSDGFHHEISKLKCVVQLESDIQHAPSEDWHDVFSAGLEFVDDDSQATDSVCMFINLATMGVRYSSRLQLQTEPEHCFSYIVGPEEESVAAMLGLE